MTVGQLIFYLLFSLAIMASLWALWMALIFSGFYGFESLLAPELRGHLLPALLLDVALVAYWLLIRQRAR